MIIATLREHVPITNRNVDWNSAKKTDIPKGKSMILHTHLTVYETV